MSWYYAENNERLGPIEDAEFQSLVASGRVTASTLVWRDGMTDWMAYGQVQAQQPTAPVVAGAPVDTSARACSQCGRLFAADEMISLSGRLVCANCKPLVVQQMMEGMDPGGSPIDVTQFLTELRARGGYRIDIGEILSRSWATVTANFWPNVGITALLIFIMMVVQNIPILGMFASLLIPGPLFAGLYLYFIKQLRGQPVNISDAFSGFNSPHVTRLLLCGLVQGVIILVLMMILLVPGVVMYASQLSKFPFDLPGGFVLWCLAAALPISYLSLCWMFSYALVIDKKLEFWPAMELSRKVVNMNLLGWIGLFIVYMLLAVAGVLAVCVGVLVVLPITYCGMMVVYESVFSSNQRTEP